MIFHQFKTLLAVFFSIAIPLTPSPGIGAPDIDARTAGLMETAEAFHAVTLKTKPAVAYVHVKKVAEENAPEKDPSNTFFNDPLLQDFFEEQGGAGRSMTPRARRALTTAPDLSSTATATSLPTRT